MTSQPIYIHIKNEILRRIHSGEWRSGEAIPPELRLAQMFGVSRMTVNRALKELTEARILERRKGSGTYVAQQKYNHTRVEISNIAEDIIRRGHGYRAVVLIQEAVMASAALAAQLLVSEGTALAHTVIVHYEDEYPIQYEERWVNLVFVPDYLSQDFTLVNTSAYLIANIPLEGGEYRVEALPARADVALALSMPKDAPALVLTRRTISQGQFANFVVMWHPGTGYQIRGVI